MVLYYDNSSNTTIYTDPLWSHLNDIKLERGHLAHRCFSVQSTEISEYIIIIQVGLIMYKILIPYYNHRFSRKKPIIPDDSVAFLLNSEGSFALKDYSTSELCLSR